MVPPIDFSGAERQAYLVRWDDDPDSDEGMTFTPISMTVLKAGDYFTLEANPAAAVSDPLSGTIAVDRLYKAHSDAFLIDGVPHLECERV